MPNRYEYIPYKLGQTAVYPEAFLDVIQKCALMSEKFDPGLLEGDKVYMTAVRMLRWAMIESFSGAIPSTKILREKFTATWKSAYYPELNKIAAPANHATFWTGPRSAAGIAVRISTFLRRYEIIHPEQPYDLVDFGYKVTGAYALVKRKTSDQHYVLVYHSHRTQSSPAPKASDVVRWLHAAGNQVKLQAEDKLGIYHLMLQRGESWHMDSLDVNMARAFSQDARNQAQSNLPSPGAHCKDCVGKACLKLYG